MTCDPDDEEAIRDEWALRDLWSAAERSYDPGRVLRYWLELTWAIYQTPTGGGIGLGRCSVLAARVVSNEVNSGL